MKLKKAFFLVLISFLLVGSMFASAESSGLVVGFTTEVGQGEKSPDNPYRIEGYHPESVAVGDFVYDFPCGPLYGNAEVQDTYDALTGVETRYWNLVVLDGTETWEYYEDYFMMVEPYPTFPVIYNPTTVVSTHGGAIGRSNSQAISFAFGSSSNPFSDYWGEDKTDVTVWKQYLADQYAAGTPVSFIYRLAEPQVIQHDVVVLEDDSLISTFGRIVTKVISLLSEFLSFFTQNPVILVPLLMFFVVGGVVGILMRILRS